MPSRDGHEIQHILLERTAETAMIESPAHLDQPPSNLTFPGIPLLLQGLDGSPIRAVGWVD